MSEQPSGSMYLRVTNRLTERVSGRYDGVDYVWKAGESKHISVAAAEHIFGFGLDDKAQSMNRLGWMPRSDMQEAAYEKLGSIDIEPVEQVFQLPKAKGKKASNPRPTATAGGDSEEGGEPLSSDELDEVI